MVMTRPPAYHPGNFLMKNMNPTNSSLTVYITYRNVGNVKYNNIIVFATIIIDSSC